MLTLRLPPVGSPDPCWWLLSLSSCGHEGVSQLPDSHALGSRGAGTGRGDLETPSDIHELLHGAVIQQDDQTAKDATEGPQPPLGGAGGHAPKSPGADLSQLSPPACGHRVPGCQGNRIKDSRVLLQSSVMFPGRSRCQVLVRQDKCTRVSLSQDHRLDREVWRPG